MVCGSDSAREGLLAGCVGVGEERQGVRGLGLLLSGDVETEALLARGDDELQLDAVDGASQAPWSGGHALIVLPL